MTVAAGDAHDAPIYNARFRLHVATLDATGTPTTATSPDTELCQDGGAWADATNEYTEDSGGAGDGYVDLIATELDTKSTKVRVKSSNCKTSILVLAPRRLPVMHTGTAQAGAGSTITLASGASAVDSYYVGCYVNITNNTPTNALGQARRITGYVGSTKVATVEAAWGTNPSSSSTYEILLTAEAYLLTLPPTPTLVPPVYAGHEFLKQSTAATVKMGPFLDVNGAALTALTIQKADVRLSKNGGAYAAANSDQGASDAGAAHTELGNYNISFNTTDTSTLGTLRASVAESPAGQVTKDFTVLAPRAYEALMDALGSFSAIISGTAATGTLTTGAMTTSLTGYNDDRLIGATVIFQGGALDKERARIADYASASGLITFSSAVTGAPANGQAFIVV